MDNWERFDETLLPNKESFYSNLNMENIDNIDYRHGDNVFRRFKLKNLGEYHDLYVQSDTLLLAMYSKTLEIRVSKYMNWILLISYHYQDLLGKRV